MFSFAPGDGLNDGGRKWTATSLCPDAHQPVTVAAAGMKPHKHGFFFAQLIAGFSDLVAKFNSFEEQISGNRFGDTQPQTRFSTRQKLSGGKHMAAEKEVYNVLFLCTHNSARSIMGEAILNNLAVSRGRFKAYSAGSHPSGRPNPFALECIQRAGLPIEGLRSKDWDEFAKPGAPRLDFVFTVCDNAANEVCPVWPGQPMTAHWGLEDPSAVEGSDERKRQAFSATFRHLSTRISIFTSLPMDKLDKLSLQKKLDEIGKTPNEPSSK
jgi:arsenate reductase